MSKEKPVIGVPYAYPAPTNPPPFPVNPPPYQQQHFYTVGNPHQAGIIPSNAIYGDPKGIPIQQTIFRDTPAPFHCVYCGESGLTDVRHKLSLAAVVGCMMPFMLGFCFLCPGMDCLWHKYHHCPACGQKVGDFEKNDPCVVVDASHWIQESFALPA